MRLPYLWQQTVKGHVYRYYRRAGQRIRVEGETDEEIVSNWLRIHKTFTAKPPVSAGSILAIIQQYRGSPDYTALSEASKQSYARYLDYIADHLGGMPVVKVTRSVVLDLRDQLADRPRTANYTVAVLRRLLSFSIDHGYRTDNPALRPRSLKTGPGYRSWTDPELEQFRAHWKPLTLERVLFELALNSGQRIGDLTRLTRQNYRDGWFHLRQSKTGQDVDLPATPVLRSILDPWLAAHEEQQLIGRLYTLDYIKHRMRKAIDVAELPRDCVMHGLRHTAATILMENGCDWQTIAAVTGHRTMQMVMEYTARLRRASRAAEKLRG